MRAPLYVVIFGTIFGTTIALAKIGAQAGLPPVALVFWQMLGAGIILGVIAWFKGQRPKLIPRHLRYYFVAGVLGNAFPTTLTFISADKIGTGLTGLVYPLSPVFTYAFATFIGMDRIQSGKMAGLAFGLIGAMIIIVSPLLTDGSQDYSEIPIMWLVIAFTIPIFLACGNIYRSRDWPPETGSLPLASGMLIATAILLLPVMIITKSIYLPDLTGTTSDWIILGNTLLSTFGFIVYFELQRTAGPVYFSQISYFITMTTMAFGVFLFNETLEWSVWIAVLIIFSGLYLVNKTK